MYATVRRYRGIDPLRSEEIARKVTESLVPTISGLSGFAGYFLFDTGEDTIASVSVFESAGEAHASTRVAATWIREQHLESALPNTPEITAGPLLAEAMQVYPAPASRA